MELSSIDLMVFGVSTLIIMIYQSWFYLASSKNSDRLNSTRRVSETVGRSRERGQSEWGTHRNIE